MLNRFKKNDKKGFTLVELIVVLVILAILAALLIPALTGYIDKAKEKQIIAETRQVVMAAQTLADEAYGTFALGSSTTITIGDAETNLKAGIIKKDDVATLAEVSVANIKTVTMGYTSNGSETLPKSIVGTVEYTRDGKKCTYTKTDTATAGTYEIGPDN